MRTAYHFVGVAIVAAHLFLGMSAPVLAQPYPSKPIRIVVPFAAGGTVDSTARIIGQPLSGIFGQPVLVDVRAGGGAVIATEFVARAAPDGYTLLLTANPHTVNPSLKARLPYDPVKDFAPITLVAVTPLFVVLHPSMQVSSIKELIALLKANPGKYNYGSSGTGGPQHLAGEMFKFATGTKMTHIPFKGAAPMAVALLAGDVQMAFSSPTNTMPYVKAGKLKALAVTTAARSRFAPELPTLAELGFTGFDESAWLGIFVPAGTSEEIVNRLYEAIVKVLSMTDTQEKLLSQGIEAISMTPDKFAVFIKTDIAKSAKIVKEAGIRPD